MSTKQIIAYGGGTKRSADGVAFIPIPEALGIAIPVVETEFKDVTNMDSPGGFREFIPGLKDAGVVTVPCGYTSAGYEQALTDQNSGVPIHYETTLKAAVGQATGDKFTYSGFPTVKVETGALDDPIKMSVDIRVTGNVVFAAGDPIE